MTEQELEQFIREGLRGLPPDALAEVADFVWFVRKKVFDPAAFRDELHSLAVRQDLSRMQAETQAHLEQEFAGYEQRHPRQP
jgi:hypothetical protein